jgi:hypothetical protein
VPRKRSAEPLAAPVNPGPLLVLHSRAVFLAADAAAALRLSASTFRREIRLGRLKICKRAGRYFVTGRQLLAWLEGGEVQPRRPAVCDNGREEANDREGGAR